MLKRKCFHIDKNRRWLHRKLFFGNFRYSPWWKFRDNDDISISYLKKGSLLGFNTANLLLLLYEDPIHIVLELPNLSGLRHCSYTMYTCKHGGGVLYITHLYDKKYKWRSFITMNRVHQASFFIILAPFTIPIKADNFKGNIFSIHWILRFPALMTTHTKHPHTLWGIKLSIFMESARNSHLICSY